MNFASIIRSLQIGQACKRPSWKGYVSKVAPTEGEKMSDGQTPVAHRLVFKQRDNDQFVYRVSVAGVVEFVTCIPASGSGSTENTKLEFDGELVQGMLSNDWISGLPADFDAAASGSGVW